LLFFSASAIEIEGREVIKSVSKRKAIPCFKA
jgi:hypothetical protein